MENQGLFSKAIFLAIPLFGFLVACQQESSTNNSKTSNESLTIDVLDLETDSDPNERTRPNLGTINGNPFQITSAYLLINAAPIDLGVLQIALELSDDVFCGVEGIDEPSDLPADYKLEFKLKLGSLDPENVSNIPQFIVWDLSDPLSVSDIAPYLPARMQCSATLSYRGDPLQNVASPTVTAELKDDRDDDILVQEAPRERLDTRKGSR